MLCRVLFLFLFFAPARVFLTTQAKLNAPARHTLSHTPNPPRHTLSHTLLRSTLNRQAKCASHAFFCSHAHAPSHLNATRQIPCHTLNHAFLRHAHHAFFIFIILNSARVLKIFINFFAVFLYAVLFLKFAFFYFKFCTDFLKFTFKISIFGFKISCLF